MWKADQWNYLPNFTGWVNMSVSLTFGSFGDIITMIQITQKLCQALSESNGSSKEFQELQQDFNGFVKVLILVSII